MKILGFIAVIIAASTFGFVFLMVIIGLIKGFIHSRNAQEIEDPLKDDPDVFSGVAAPLGKGDMNPFEATSVRAPLPMLIGAVCIMAIIIGFSAYGLREMAGSTGTTAKMRQEAKAKAEKNEQKYGSANAIEEEGETSRGSKKQPSAEDLQKLGQ
jgi:hypothetical protein